MEYKPLEKNGNWNWNWSCTSVIEIVYFFDLVFFAAVEGKSAESSSFSWNIHVLLISTNWILSLPAAADDDGNSDD